MKKCFTDFVHMEDVKGKRHVKGQGVFTLSFCVAEVGANFFFF